MEKTLSQPLSGVIAAVATPIDESGAPDLKRAINLARYLLDNGCDGLNVLGTTGEATSFSLDERKAVMDAYKSNGLPLHRLMVGTGAAAISRCGRPHPARRRARLRRRVGVAAILLQRRARRWPCRLHRNIGEDDGTKADSDLSLSFPGNVGPAMARCFDPPASEIFLRSRIVGLKDSSGDMAYARSAAAISKNFAVFPSTEACLIEARSGDFAGCISATANLNAGPLRASLEPGDTACARRRSCDPQTFRRQAAGLRREGTACSYT